MSQQNYASLLSQQKHTKTTFKAYMKNHHIQPTCFAVARVISWLSIGSYMETTSQRPRPAGFASLLPKASSNDIAERPGNQTHVTVKQREDVNTLRSSNKIRACKTVGMLVVMFIPAPCCYAKVQLQGLRSAHHLEENKVECQSLHRLYGCFQTSWYPQIIHFNRVFHYKPSILVVKSPIFGSTPKKKNTAAWSTLNPYLFSCCSMHRQDLPWRCSAA